MNTDKVFWKLSKSERNTLTYKLKHLKEHLKHNEDEIIHLEHRLKILKLSISRDQKEIQEIQEIMK